VLQLQQLIARAITSLMYFVYFIGDKNLIKIKIPNFKPTLAIYKEILKIGISLLILQILQTIAISKISYAASFYGEEAIAAMGIVLRIVTLGTNVVAGYMKGLQPIAGFNYGAKNYGRVQEAIKASIKWTTLFCIVWTAIIYLFAPSILSVFGKDKDVIRIAIPSLRAAVIMFITFGFQFTYATLYLAIGKALAGVFFKFPKTRHCIYTSYFTITQNDGIRWCDICSSNIGCIDNNNYDSFCY